MKKILAALLVGAFGISAVAKSVVYDYRATFKRVDPQYKVRTVVKESSSSYKAVTESYGVTSDTITGYIILPICTDCDGSLDSSVGDNFEGWAYLVRRGDKLSKKAKLPYVVKTEASAESVIFGKDAYIVGVSPSYTPDVKKMKSASMILIFDLPGATDFDPVRTIDGKLLISNAGSEDIYFGAMGLDHKTYSPWFVTNAGFGTVKVVSGSEAATLGFCNNTPGSSCSIIQSISGSVVGKNEYAGMCDMTPMWDLCDPADNMLAGSDAAAPIAGTWTLKYNASLSKLEDSAKEEAILKKLKASSSDMYLFESIGE